jgi:chromosome partition protein MukB
MNRARATALCLANWKGVFFERYQLDRHVTALEGGNGAGKTTVMVAAYVALLPDLQRLKFVNVGESGATGGDRGIWGRLGEEGPSYSALEIELAPGQRVLCGVLLERKAAPSLSLTPFLITQLSEAVTAHELLLLQRDGLDEIPTLPEVSKRAAQLGASCEVFGSVREYFSRLFELGIGALRLGTDEERNKFNDMLRTSMTGGISRTLTNDLRSFLFKRESGLFDTLSRMRQNLEACRRTRLEVSEARVLEHEIGGIYSAGHAMFLAALGAGRQRAQEARSELARVEQAQAALRQRVLELETVESEVLLRKSSLAPRLGRARIAEEVARGACSA